MDFFYGFVTHSLSEIRFVKSVASLAIVSKCLFQRANDLILLKSNLNIEDPMEKEMVTHTSILAWEILWTEEPGGLQSMRFQRVSHSLATKQPHTHALSHTHIYREREKKGWLLCLSKSLSLTQGHSSSFYFLIEYYSFRLYT